MFLIFIIYQDSIAQIRAHQFQIFFMKWLPKFCQHVHYYQLIIKTQKLPSLKFQIYFKMHSPFLHGLKVWSHCEVLPNLSWVARKFCAGQVLSCWWFIFSSNDILNLYLIHRQAVSVARFFFLENIIIVILDHIKIMAVTVALIWFTSLQLSMNSSLAILSNSLIHTPAGHI